MAQSSSPLASVARPFKALFDSDAFAGVLLIFIAAAAVLVAAAALFLWGKRRGKRKKQ